MSAKAISDVGERVHYLNHPAVAKPSKLEGVGRHALDVSQGTNNSGHLAPAKPFYYSSAY